ncbi:reverse transcriptase domain-containing protein [Tanacetum coccineum]
MDSIRREQIEEAVKLGQLTHLIKELKKGGNKGEPAKASKKGETSKKKAATIFMVQPWQRVTRQKVTKIFSVEGEISFSPLANSEGQENPMVIEAKIGGGEDHSASALMNFMVVRSPCGATTSWLIRNFKVLKRTRMLTNVKTYDGTGDLEDHMKIFQTAAKIERWAMPTWCHMFNSTLIGSARVWFDKLPPESVDSYEALSKAFLGNFSQQKKYIKDPVEIHYIKQKEGESVESFMK